jgi:hypothetical protein
MPKDHLYYPFLSLYIRKTTPPAQTLVGEQTMRCGVGMKEVTLK